jgi:hypothetical protein
MAGETMSKKHGWSDVDSSKQKNSQRNLSQCHFVYHKSQMDSPSLEPTRPRWEAGD